MSGCLDWTAVYLACVPLPVSTLYGTVIMTLFDDVFRFGFIVE